MPKKPPATYRYDSSLSPSLEWDSNPAREQVESETQRIDITSCFIFRCSHDTNK
jgi:hypothetical protein